MTDLAGYHIRLATLQDLASIKQIETQAGSRFAGTGLLDKLVDRVTGEIRVFDQEQLKALVRKEQVWVDVPKPRSVCQWNRA
jgi:hypothetical protein